jgi:hypothetical protein
MMADPKQIEEELRQFLAIEDSIRKADRLSYLMAIINKHYALDQIEHVISKHDFDSMLSYAKTIWPTTVLPMEISKKDVTSQEANYVLMMEALLGYLNNKKILKRLVKFDYTRRK